VAESLPRITSLAASPSNAIAVALVKPGIRVLSKEAIQLRGIRPVPESNGLYVYLGLFDPIIELGRQLQVVGESGETQQAHEIELLISELEDEQSAAARGFGFRACAIGFTEALGGAQ
jgi:hypothetical protein